MPLDLPVQGDEPDRSGKVQVVALRQRQQEQRAAEPTIAIMEGVNRKEAGYDYVAASKSQVHSPIA